MQLQLPTPLRPEHRLTQLAAVAAAAPLSARPSSQPQPSLHPLLAQLQSCTHSKPAWSLQHPATASAADLTSLPIHARKQLMQLDDESLRIRCISDIIEAIDQPVPNEAANYSANASPTLSAAGASPSASPLRSPALAARSMPQLALTPPAIRITLADVQSKGQSSCAAVSNAACVGWLWLTSLLVYCLSACGSGCPLLFVRLLLVCRAPDYLLRLLKWLVQCQSKLAEQKKARPTDASPATNACVKQIDRVMAHWSVANSKRCGAACPHSTIMFTLIDLFCRCSVFMEEMIWKLLWRLEQLIKSGQCQRGALARCAIRMHSRLTVIVGGVFSLGVLSTCVCMLPESAEKSVAACSASSVGLLAEVRWLTCDPSACCVAVCSRHGGTTTASPRFCASCARATGCPRLPSSPSSICCRA